MVIEFQGKNSDIVFCFVDNTWKYHSFWTRELIKNQSDFTITNITQKGYTVLQGIDEDQLIQKASENFKHAVVFSTGTEFINGYDFFNEITKEILEDYLIKGHILDRDVAYYELHHQCYLINLVNFRKIGQPFIGQAKLGEKHIQFEPIPSKKMIHDDYTPVFIEQGKIEKTYYHKMHGWNILSLGINYYKICAFSDAIRKSKKHYYPENQEEFLKHSDWIYKRENYCSRDFVHKKATDWSHEKLEGIEQVLTPASGDWWLPYITQDCSVIMYDYNLKSINYWKSKNPSYSFIICDLLCDDIDLTSLDINKKTLINLSNIFAYEGTTFTHSLEKRLSKETNLINKIKEYIPNAYISFSSRACSGFTDCMLHGLAREFDVYSVNKLKTPSWHMNGDWGGNTV